MRNSIHKALALGAVTFALCASAAVAQSPAPAASPSPAASGSASPMSAKAKATSAATHTAIVTCLSAVLYSWPDRTTVPFRSGYPAARQGDAFGVIGTGTLTNNGQNLTETTIDVVQPYGVGKHYWIATECVT